PPLSAGRRRAAAQDRGGRRGAGRGLRLSPQHPEAGRSPLRLRPRARRHARAPKLFASRAALAVLSEMADLEISRAHQTLAIGAADMETARNLGIALNAPTAEARCVVTDAGGTVIYVG